MYQKDDILFLDHFDTDNLISEEVRRADHVVGAFGTIIKTRGDKYGKVGDTFDRTLLKDPTPRMVPTETRVVRYDLTLVVEEPEATPGVDMFSLALLADILEEAGYTSRLANGPTDRGNMITMVLKKEPK